MHIVKLVVENVKCLHAVEIVPQGNLVQITGPNGAGKSCVLDAIPWALAGKRLQPPEPIRRGATDMTMLLDLGDIVIKRTENADGRRQLRLERPDGSRVPKSQTPHGPQTLLDELYDERTFGLQAFSQLPPKDQAATLRRVAGLDFDDLDGKRLGFFDKRTDVRRDLKVIKAQRDGIPDIEAPEEEVSVAELSQQLAVAMELKQANGAIRRDDAAAVELVHRACDQVDQANQAVKNARESLFRCEQQAEALRKQADTLQDPDTDAIQQQIAGAEQVNRRVREKKRRAALTDDVNAIAATDESLTAQIDAIDAEKANALAKATMPIEDLGVEGERATFKGLPLEQACSSDKLIVSAAVGLALHPELRIALERNGSLLDAEHLARLEEWAEEEEVQVWLECVGDDASVGVHIVDGYVSGAEAPAEGTT